MPYNSEGSAINTKPEIGVPPHSQTVGVQTATGNINQNKEEHALETTPSDPHAVEKRAIERKQRKCQTDNERQLAETRSGGGGAGRKQPEHIPKTDKMQEKKSECTNIVR
jgi:hypothetical protein